MSEIMGKERRNHSKLNSKAKTRQDVVTKAIPNVVQALTAIVSDSKSDDFKQKCCKMFEVDDTSSITVHLEARLWEIARTKLGVTLPADTNKLHQSNANVRTESEKDDFEDLMFVSYPDEANCYEEESIKDQVNHDRTKNIFSRTSEFMPAFNTESEQNSLKQGFGKSDSKTKALHNFSDISWNPSDSECDLSWHLLEDNHKHQVRETSHPDNEDFRMSGLSELATSILHVSSVQENEHERTQGGACGNPQLTTSSDSPSALEINPSLHQTMQQKKLKSPVCLQKTLPGDSHDDDWLDNYEQDDFWMDHSCFEVQRRVAKSSKVEKGSSYHWKSWNYNKLAQIPNTVCVGYTTTMEIRKDAVESYHDNLKENGGLETCCMMENCCPTATTFHCNNKQQICKLASSSSPRQRMEAEWKELQTSYHSDQLEVCNDDNFEALADFS